MGILKGSSKNNLIDSLYFIISNSTSKANDPKKKDNSYFKRRVLGFTAELEVTKEIKKCDIEFLEGGQIIWNTSKQINSYTYTTVDHKNPIEYTDIYFQLAQWPEVKKLIYIKYCKDIWYVQDYTVKKYKKKGSTKVKDVKILKPKFEVFTFDRKNKKFTLDKHQNFSFVDEELTKKKTPSKHPLLNKDKFNFFYDYTVDELQKIYATRFFLNVILYAYTEKTFIDFDGFIKYQNKYNLIEIKEKEPIIKKKDPTNKDHWFFGWDSRRLVWYSYIFQQLAYDTLYIVREVTINGNERIYKSWQSIFLSDFLKGANWSQDRGGTLITRYGQFNKLEQNLKLFKEKLVNK